VTGPAIGLVLIDISRSDDTGPPTSKRKRGCRKEKIRISSTGQEARMSLAGGWNLSKLLSCLGSFYFALPSVLFVLGHGVLNDRHFEGGFPFA
jgi:hypothetical protein